MCTRLVNRKGKKVWVVDAGFTSDKGDPERYRRDASVQTRAGAEADERALMAYFRDHRTIVGFREKVPTGPAATPPTTEKTWSDAVTQWRSVGLVLKRHETRVLYGKILDSGYLSPWASAPLTTINQEALERLDATLAESKVGPSRRRHFAAVYRGVLRGAKTKGWLTRLPDWPPLPKVPKRRMPIPSQADIALLVGEKDTCDQYRASQRRAARLAFVVSAYSGLRAGEVRGLRWADVELSPKAPKKGSGAGTITVRCSRGSKGVEGPPKSGADRVIPIAPVLWTWLHQARQEALSRSGQSRVDQQYVAVDRDGNPWSEWALRGALRRACVRLDIPERRYHSLRHYFVTALFTGGASAPVVQALAGHEHLSVTQRYAHVVDEQKLAAVAALGCGNGAVTGKRKVRK